MMLPLATFLMAVTASPTDGALLGTWTYAAGPSAEVSVTNGQALTVRAGDRWVLRVRVGERGGSLTVPVGVASPLSGVLVVYVDAARSDGPGRADIVLGGSRSPRRQRRLWFDSEWRTASCWWRCSGERDTTLTLGIAGPSEIFVRSIRVEWRDWLPEPAVPARLQAVGNGGFELGLCGWAALGDGLEAGVLSTTSPAEGRFCLELGGPPSTRRIRYAAFPVPSVKAAAPTGVCSARCFKLQAGQQYVASAMLRGSVEEQPVVLSVVQDSGARAVAELKCTTSWRRYDVRFTADGAWGYLAVQLGRGGDGQAPLAWVDSISVAPTDAPDAQVIDVAVLPSSPTGCYAAGESMSVVVRAIGGPADQEAEVEGTVLDITDARVAGFSGELAVRGGSVSDATFPVDVVGTGLFTVAVTVRAGDLATTASVRLARFPIYRDPDSPFGVSRGWDTDLPFRLARRAGVCWVRDWSGMRDVVQPERDKSSFLTTHAYRVRFRELGLNVLYVVPFPSAPWEADVKEDQWRQQGIFGFVGSRAYLPDDPGSFPRYVGSLASEMGSDADAIELLQEPLVSGWSMPRAVYGAVDYAALCRDTRAVLDEAGWKGVLVGGVGLPSGGPAEGIITELARAGLSNDIDAWNAHAYPLYFPPEVVGPAFARLSEQDAHKPIWVTELGLWGDDDPSPVALAQGVRPLDSELDAAEQLVRVCAVLLSSGVERVFFSARSRDAHEAGPGTDWIVSPTGEPRKALPVLAALADLLGPAAKPAGTAHRAGTVFYVFDGRRGGVAVACPDYSRPKALPAGLPSDVNVLDLCGSPLRAAPLAGVPYYVEAPGRDAQRLLAELR